MKKILIVVAILIIGMSKTSAQSEYKAFKVDVGALYGIPSGDGVKAGAGFYLEPKYNITDNLALGLKMEWAIMGGEEMDGLNVDVSAINTYQLTGDYYFGTSKVRPFIGLGAGIYALGSLDFDTATDEFSMDGSIDLGSKFGFAPRAGILLGHLRLAVEYNVITGVDSDYSDSKNYLAFKLGFEIGGGKK